VSVFVNFFKKNYSLIFVLFLWFLGTSSVILARTITIDDILNLNKIGNVLMSPDGSKVLFISSGNIWVSYLNQESPKNYKLGYGSLPQWSPDGTRIAFLKKQDDIKQIFICTLPQTNPDIFFQNPVIQLLTDSKKNIEFYKWSPDSQKIAYLVSEKNEIATPSDIKVNVINNQINFSARNIWIFDLTTSRFKQVTKCDEYITYFDWAPDNNKIVFACQPGLMNTDSLLSHCSILNLDTNIVTDLIPNIATADLPCLYPKWSADGRYIFYQHLDDPKDIWLGTIEIGVYDLKNQKQLSFPILSNESIVNVYTYSPETKMIYYLAQQGIAYNLCGLNIETGKIVAITKGIKIYEEFTFSKNFLKTAFVMEDSDTPPELYYSFFPQINPQKITSFNQYLTDIDFGQTEVIHWQTKDKAIIEGMLVKPLHFDPKKRYPLLVILHGGPADCFSNRFINGRWNYPPKMYADQNFLIFMPNPRGSTGYGKDFKLALVSNWGVIDYEDVMEGIDYLVQEKKIVDPERMGIAGWSYGGYLTGITITKTNRFKAAYIGAGITNIFSLYGTIDIPDWVISYFKDYPFNQSTNYLNASPVYNAKHIQTPVLVQHGEKDSRVPFTQSKELYQVLTAQKKSIQYVIYPKEGHIFYDPVTIRDSIERNLKWFLYYLKN